MHEMGIAMQIAEIATSSIPDNMANARIEKVNLRVGKLAAIVPDSLSFCFEIAVKDTPLAGASLNIEEVPVTAKCKECGFKWTITSSVFKCTKCESGSIEILSGRELDVVSIEVAEPES